MTQTLQREGELAPPHADGIHVVKRALVGAPMPSHSMEETLLRKALALPIFASDALSSVAYATEAALVVLIGTSLASAYLILPVSAAVSLLLAIVVLSYRQTVRAYSTSGGSYVVSRENLGTIPSLVAGAALLTDYVLTVAVSVAAGVLAIVSAVPALQHLTLELAVAAVVLITVVNLRGVRESGVAFAIPTYAFILALLALILTGVTRCTLGTCPTAVVPDQLPAGAGAITAFVLLRAFASGSSALTGVEAISNGVGAFRHPQARNAARTLGILAAVAITFFMGVSWLAYEMHALPSGSASVVSQVARATFPTGSTFGFMFWVVQITTFAILILAANTSFQGFPRLAAMLARDRFFPRQFGNLGDRLVYSNGIIVLSGLAVFLLWVYDAQVDSLIHLYVIGVFTAFTLSQAGMVRYWRRTGWAEVEAQRRRQRCRGNCDRGRARDRDPDEVHPGRLARDRRDPSARPCLSRDSSALPAHGTPAPCRRGRRDRSLAAQIDHRHCRRSDRRRHRASRLVRERNRRKHVSPRPRPRARQRPRNPRPLAALDQRRPAPGAPDRSGGTSRVTARARLERPTA